jgi:alkyl hydroperoxide reductase subunit F
MNLNPFRKKSVSKNIYDLIIVGAGPGGMTAAIYAARRKLKFCIISLDIGGQMSWSPEVANYPGTTSCTGIELTKNFYEHLKEYKIKIKQEEIVKISKKGKACITKTKNNSYESKAVIIATGKSPKKLGVPGEDKFLGKGVNYCATCDAPLYKNKMVAVVGGGNSGLESALFLSKYAKKVYLLHIGKTLSGEPYLKDKISANHKISIFTEAKTKEILGGKSVTGLKYEKDGKEKIMKVDSVFVEIGLITKADFTDAKKNKWGEVMLFRSTKTHEENMTSIPGIFAAGDCTDVPVKQIVVAAGDGAKAALASFDYINKWDKSSK